MSPRRVFAYVFALLVSLLFLATSVARASSINSPDTEGDVGLYSSIVLDAAGNPVISYYDADYGDLKVLHCNDPDCAGSNDSINSPDTTGNVGMGNALALDSAGNPVISYFDASEGDLKLMHCNDPNCAGGGESITRPDTGGIVGSDTSLVLDAAGNPVVSYYDLTNGDLKVLHCNDRNCAGGGESITSPDTGVVVGTYTSLALDADGYPVVSYYDTTNADLKVLHCNDPNCAGGDESITSPDTTGIVGWYTSLALDSAGNPVVSYTHDTYADLKVLHCNDPNCAGGDDSINSPDTIGVVGYFTSLALDARDNPVVSYFDSTNGDLKLLHCGDPDCSAGTESITSPNTGGSVGVTTSLVLDDAGNPVVSYSDIAKGDLKVLHCSNARCATVDGTISSPDTVGPVGVNSSLALDASGNPAVSYYDVGSGDLKLLQCNDPGCSGEGESISTVDSAGSVGLYSSLALDAAGNAVIAYQHLDNGDLKIVHCNDPGCLNGGESYTTADNQGVVGAHVSLALDAAGHPVASYYDSTNDDLKVLRCYDPNCAVPAITIRTRPDTGGDVGLYTSLALDAAGNPVISYYDATNGDLKILHCSSQACAGGGDSITSPDTIGDVGWYTSLALDAAGNPVVSYYDASNSSLKILHCNDPNCAGGGESITSPDTVGDLGWYTSLALDAAGNPVVSYADSTNNHLKILHCNDPNCAGEDESITSPDPLEATGWFTSLALDATGNPVVSYYDISYADLKLLHCFDQNCGLNVAPEVNAGDDQTAAEGDIVDFAGSASDENGDDLAITWDFGDGSTVVGTLTLQHAYADDGDYTVTLTATDGAGLTTSDMLSVLVSNVAPAVDAGPDAAVQVGNVYQFAGSFTDPGTADTHDITWDFGDGSVASGSLTPSHVFANPGVHTVTLSVTDDDGGAGSDSLTVTVTEGPPLTDRLFLPLFRR